MRFFVVGPLAAFSILFLLLLMVQLAGINVSKVVQQPILLSAPVFDFNTATFTQSNESLQQEQQLEMLEPIQELVSESAPEVDFSEPLTEVAVEPLVQKEIEIEMPKVDVGIELALTENLLANVVIAKPRVTKKIKSVSKPRTSKKLVSKTSKPKPVSKKNIASSAANSGASSQSSNKSTAVSSRTSSPISKVKPKYPSRARRRGIEGEVTVSFIVNKNGSVAKSSIRVVDARPAKVFNKSVYLAVAKWRFAKNSRSYRTKQRLVFSLKN